MVQPRASIKPFPSTGILKGILSTGNKELESRMKCRSATCFQVWSFLDQTQNLLCDLFMHDASQFLDFGGRVGGTMGERLSDPKTSLIMT